MYLNHIVVGFNLKNTKNIHTRKHFSNTYLIILILICILPWLQFFRINTTKTLIEANTMYLRPHYLKVDVQECYQ